MKKEELFKKYSIDETHNIWENQIDNWSSIEIYRLMHYGQLPSTDDLTTKWIVDFLDKSINNMNWWVKNVMSRNDWGNLYLTAKRMVYKFHVEILKELKP